ncbi:hypothetical protein [Halorubrum halodurans]|uniref:hypothetical protein n=1 Tax=Halorubrum halodurans TaxID=1383851 RepID=UPI00117A804F|nr:hypothetical protein [Halorubrum halodurans]
MATTSSAGPRDGLKKPADIEVFRVTPEDESYMADHERPVVVVMWHGNGYERDDCWIQIDQEAACDLDSWQ